MLVLGYLVIITAVFLRWDLYSWCHCLQPTYLCLPLTGYIVARCYSATFSTYSHWFIFNWGRNVYTPLVLPRQHQFFSEDSTSSFDMYRCEHCPAVFTTRRLWRRHSRTQQIHLSSVWTYLHYSLWVTTTFGNWHCYHFDQGWANNAKQVLTPTKNRVKRAITY